MLIRKLPELDGKSIRIRFLPGLTADCRRVYSNQPFGEPVHAGAFIRKRIIVFDSELRRRPKELARILVHELFHFAWARLGNQARESWEDLIRREFILRARGELGWSAESRKRLLTGLAGAPLNGLKWRDYLCESFCDTAAWLYSGAGEHVEFTLARRYRDRRAKWFRATYFGTGIPV